MVLQHEAGAGRVGGRVVVAAGPALLVLLPQRLPCFPAAAAATAARCGDDSGGGDGVAQGARGFAEEDEGEEGQADELDEGMKGGSGLGQVKKLAPRKQSSKARQGRAGQRTVGSACGGLRRGRGGRWPEGSYSMYGGTTSPPTSSCFTLPSAFAFASAPAAAACSAPRHSSCTARSRRRHSSTTSPP
jgi:hypothetical protein